MTSAAESAVAPARRRRPCCTDGDVDPRRMHLTAGISRSPTRSERCVRAYRSNSTGRAVSARQHRAGVGGGRRSPVAMYWETDTDEPARLGATCWLVTRPDRWTQLETRVAQRFA